MKTKNLMLSLVAIFMSVSMLTAQTETSAKPTKACTKTEAKSCCKDVNACKTDPKTCDKKDCPKKDAKTCAKKECTKKDAKTCDKKASAKK